MKLFIRVSLLFLLALAVAGFSRFNTGSVTLYLGNYEAILSLNLLLIVWLVSFAVIYYLLRLYINLRRLPNRIQRNRARNTLISSRRHLNDAGLHYFEGKYRSCYDNALKSMKREINPDNKFLAYMLAFRAANVMRDSETEAKISAEMNQFSEPKWQLAKHLVIAENLYNEQRFGQCIDNLNAVLQLDHKHIQARRMLLKVYLNLANYSKAYEVLTWLLKNDSLREYKASKYKARVISGLFKAAVSAKELSGYYNKLARDEKVSFLYAKLYFDGLLRLAEYALAIEFLADNLKVETLHLIYSDAILALSKKLEDKIQVDKLNLIAEKSLFADKSNANLLLALGILSYHQQRFAKSQAYLEASSNLKPSLDVYVFLGLVAKDTQNSQLLAESHQQLIANIRNLA
ncbi:MAG: HemY protein [Pseudomonadota bacterium]|nr:HemY protein [Pseudomonadota bacterium]